MNDKQNIISLSAVGLDMPGLVAKITTKIYEMGGNIIDVEENCLRGLFSIFLIIDFSSTGYSKADITDSLMAIEKGTGLKIVLETYDPKDVRYRRQKESHIVTVLGVDQPGIIAKISTFFYGYHINIENCKMIALGTFFSMEMVIDTSRMTKEKSVSRRQALANIKSELKDLCNRFNLSVVVQSEDLYQKTKKLVVFDVESSLIQDSSLRGFIEKIEGKANAVDWAIQMEDDSRDKMETLIENARTLKGIPLSDFEEFGKILQLHPGALELIRILKSMGFKIALLSSGFSFFLKDVFADAGVDYAFSNTLMVDEKGVVTGELEEPIITNDNKDELLEFIMDVEEIHRDQVIAIGDGSTRSHYMKNMGLSIAFKPDETGVTTDGILGGDKIINMLYCLGIPRTELEHYFKKNGLS
jgi:phosphoserine phosphatase